MKKFKYIPFAVAVLTASFVLSPARVNAWSTSENPSRAQENVTVTFDQNETNSEEGGSGSPIVDVASARPDLSKFVQALKASDYLVVLRDQGAVTIFAPSDAAFDKLPAGTWANLMKPENKEKLKTFLSAHVIPNRISAADIKSGTFKTVNGKVIAVKVSGSNIMANDSKVVGSDAASPNATIFIVDRVLQQP